jgi:uncharacterized protein (DUF983 family)
MFEHPIRSGLSLKCGRCGEGKLFGAYLKFRSSCDHCGLDYGDADTADGPAFFVSSLIMIVFAPFYFLLPILEAPLLMKIALWIGLLGTMILTGYLLLPRFKAILFNLQIQNQAEEAKFESTGSHGKAPKNWKH